jgi:glycerol-3-phosphate acyltransferase PlsX
MVCDGFLGNIVLKLAEGVAEFFRDYLREEIKKHPLAALAAKTVQQPVWRALRARTDYAQFGGAPLLGLKGNVVICHGRSTATAIANALAVGQRMVASGASTAVAQLLQGYAWKQEVSVTA